MRVLWMTQVYVTLSEAKSLITLRLQSPFGDYIYTASSASLDSKGIVRDFPFLGEASLPALKALFKMLSIIYSTSLTASSPGRMSRSSAPLVTS